MDGVVCQVLKPGPHSLREVGGEDDEMIIVDPRHAARKAVII